MGDSLLGGSLSAGADGYARVVGEGFVGEGLMGDLVGDVLVDVRGEGLLVFLVLDPMELEVYNYRKGNPYSVDSLPSPQSPDQVFCVPPV